jgi:hypothetical protein
MATATETPIDPAVAEAGEMLWVMLANVSLGDWSKQTQEWRHATRKWVDNFHNVAASLNAKVS